MQRIEYIMTFGSGQKHCAKVPVEGYMGGVLLRNRDDRLVTAENTDEI